MAGISSSRTTSATLTSGRDLLRLQERATESGRALIVANPEFGSAHVRGHACTRPPHGRADRSVAGALQPASRNCCGSDGALRADAGRGSSDRTRCHRSGDSRAVHGPRVLHLATHGFFLGCARGRLRRRIARSRARHRVEAGIDASDNPSASLRPCIRRRERARSGEDDGILTALEASSLDLWGTRMAVLSACETGVGETRRGDGVYGLRRALVVAGAESQVMSLWQVSDEGTRALMTDFYTKLKAGVARSAALRRGAAADAALRHAENTRTTGRASSCQAPTVRSRFSDAATS